MKIREILHEVTYPPFVQRYLHGHCDALAVALAVALEKPIVAFYPMHQHQDGSVRRDPDFVHVAIRDGTQVMDAKGLRSVSAMMADFSSLLALVKRPEDIQVTAVSRIFPDAREFIAETNCNPAEPMMAFRDLLRYPPLARLIPSDKDLRRLIQAELKELADEHGGW
jgi:hypothetical protein